jgi:hypothetical protein
MKSFQLVTISILALITACDPGQPGGSVDFQASGYAASLSQNEFNSLPPEEQYQVANKLMGAMFRGISAEDFFDLSAGTSNLKLKASSSTFLTDTRKALTTDAGTQLIASIDSTIDGLDNEGNPTLPSRYIFDTTTNIEFNDRPRQLPLARIKEYPISREFFTQWMAYFLANTIMFSPAEEMETADFGDVQSMYSFLTTNLKADNSVRNIVRSNLPTLARWRVSRSPENHALEAYELYLGLFETEEDSFRGGIACKDFYLTPENQGYLLRTTSFPNTVPQLILDTYYVTTCSDLYDAIAGHTLLMPRVTEVIINYLMAGRSLEDRLSMIASITSSGAETFEDIFLSILFSREYLLNTERPKSYEENLMPLLDALKWSPVQSPVDARIFARMTSDSSSDMHMDKMGWDSMSLKIGRLPDVPLDGLSFANYHKSLRDNLLMNTNSYEGGRSLNTGDRVGGLFYDDAFNARTNISNLSIEDFIDFLFLNALQRKASSQEKIDLIAIFSGPSNLTTIVDGVTTIRSPGCSSGGENTCYDDAARITYDYISRLPELYYFRAVN